MRKINPNISRNFHVLKFLSIMMVFFGHFFNEIELVWVPVTVGLLIFSFSSGYFTGIKYTGSFSKKRFFINKVRRLGPNLLVINMILFVLFLYQGQSGLWSWHTLVNILGLNGFLNWFYIDNISPYGKGMWYLTLLIIFYIFYPLLGKLGKNAMIFFTIISIVVAYSLSLKVHYGHALWLTYCGFICGVCAGKGYLLIPANLSRVLSLIIFLIILVSNFVFNLKAFNFFLILFFSLCFIFSTYDLKFLNMLFPIFPIFSACLLEIYLLHPYFSIRFTQVVIIDFLLSVVFVLIISKFASVVSNKLFLSMGNVTA